MTNIQHSVQRSAAILGASGSCWQLINKARVVHDRNDGSIITEVKLAGFVE